MIINKNDFKLDKIDKTEEYIDYWFKVSGETKNNLTDKYMEQSMIEVTDVVYSEDEDENVVGIKRWFPFNCDVIISNDLILKNILKDIIKEIKD